MSMLTLGLMPRKQNSRSEASRFSELLSPALLRCLTLMPPLLPSFFPPGPSNRTKIDGYHGLAQQFIPHSAYSCTLLRHGYHIPVHTSFLSTATGTCYVIHPK